MRRMHHQHERFRRLARELGEFVKECGQFVLVRGPALRAQSGAYFKHDGVDDGIAIENFKNSLEISGRHSAAANRSAGVERIAKAAADNVEETAQFRI